MFDFCRGGEGEAGASIIHGVSQDWITVYGVGSNTSHL